MKTCSECEIKEICNLRTQPAPEGYTYPRKYWQGCIKCDDELPPKYENVLVFYSVGAMSFDSVDINRKWRIHQNEGIIAWRPLPKYEEER